MSKFCTNETTYLQGGIETLNIVRKMAYSAGTMPNVPTCLFFLKFCWQIRCKPNAVLLTILLTHVSSFCKAYSTNLHSTHYVYIPLSVSSNKGAEGTCSLHHSLPFISTLLMLFQQNNQQCEVVRVSSCSRTYKNAQKNTS